MSEFIFPVGIEVDIKNEKMFQHFRICRLLGNIYKAKNHDYGDSFHKTYQEFGKVAIAIRLQDKVSRLSALSTKEQQLVKDESIRDTLLDIANYAILGIMEMDLDDCEAEKEPSSEESLWPEITEDTTIEDAKRIHQRFWDYIIDNGEAPTDRYVSNVSPVCYVVGRCTKCPIIWPKNENGKCLCTINNGLYSRWYNASGEEKSKLARQIRDLPWKFEQEKDS